MLSKTFESASIALSAVLCIAGLPVAAQTANYGGMVNDLLVHLGGQTNGVAVDANLNVFVSVLNRTSIAEVLSYNGELSGTPTVVWIGSGFKEPHGLTLDKLGNLYVADSSNNAVKEIVAVNGSIPSDPEIRTLGSGFDRPLNVAVDESGNVYVADYSATPIKEIMAVNGSIPPNPVIKSLGSGFRDPHGVAVDGNGNVFVADSANDKVKEILVNGTIRTLGSGFLQPQNLVVDGNGNVLVADSYNNAVKEIVAQNGTIGDNPTVLTLGGQGNLTSGFNWPLNVALDTKGNVYVADTRDEMVAQIYLQPLAFGPVGDGGVGLFGGAALLNFNFSSSGTIEAPGVFTQGATGLDFTDYGAGTCTTQGTTHIYNAGDFCTVLVAFTPTQPGIRYGAVTLRNSSGTVIASANFTGLDDGPRVSFPSNPVMSLTVKGGVPSNYMATDGNGNLYVGGESSVEELIAVNGSVPNQPKTRSISVPNTYLGSTHLAVDGSGNLWFAQGQGLFELLAVNGQLPSTPTIVGFGFPSGGDLMTIDGGGNLYFSLQTNTGWSVVEVPVLNGSIPQNPTIRTLATGFNEIFGEAVDGNGNIFVADLGGLGTDTPLHEILAVNGSIPANPTVRAFNSFTVSSGVAVDGLGNVYVADNGTGFVSEMLAVNGNVPANPTIVPLFKNGSFPLGSVAVDGRGTVYAYKLEKLDRSDPPSLNFAQTPVGQTSADSPQTISIANTGNADLTLPPPSIGTNPSISTNFKIGSSSTCPNLSGSTATPGTLPPLGTCTEMISFVPTTTGAITGSLVFTDNAFPTTQTVFLSGNVQPTQPPPPTFSLPSAFYNNDQTLTLTDPATIYYTTDGTSPLSSSKIYSGPITLSSTQTVSAVANATGLNPSKSVSEKIYFQVALPQFAPAPGRYIGAQSVSITDPTIGSTIYYTTDGSVPTTASNKYTGPVTVTVTVTVSGTEELRAIAVRTGYQNSYTDLARYTIVVPTPVISPPAGKYSSPVTVTITDAAAATIYYTVNGATPTTSSTVYSGPFTLSNSATVKAIAVSTGEVNSAGVEAAYTLAH
jgi:hypothetical protein